MSTYDLTPYVATAPPPPPPPRPLWCEVTLTLRGTGEVRTEGWTFLDAPREGDAGPRLSLGLLLAVAAYLRVDEPDGRHAAQIIHEIERQLARRPWAVLACPEGELRVTLVPAMIGPDMEDQP